MSKQCPHYKQICLPAVQPNGFSKTHIAIRLNLLHVLFSRCLVFAVSMNCFLLVSSGYFYLSLH